MADNPEDMDADQGPTESRASTASRAKSAAASVGGFEGIDAGKGGIRVVVRVRPLNKLELSREDPKAIIYSDDGTSLKITEEGREHNMTFHQVFSEKNTQTEVFNKCGVRELIDHTLDGYATTVFTYGQTGSGKTYTLTGPEGVQLNQENAGLMQRALAYLYEEIMRRPNSTMIVRASYCEIYNENAFDLLNPHNAILPVRWNSEKGFYVENLLSVECEVLDDVYAVLETGVNNRTVASHRQNEHSSRSHSLLTIYVDSVNNSDETSAVRHGKITFVDLAGSEKVTQTGATGEVFKESLSINNSLLTLGKVIALLGDPKSRDGHIPYRDSKLTKLLSDSIGGEGLALMIACCSPSAVQSPESFKTLSYAKRAKRIKNKPVLQLEPHERIILALKKEVFELNREMDILKTFIPPERLQAAIEAAKQPGAEPSANALSTMDVNALAEARKSIATVGQQPSEYATNRPTSEMAVTRSKSAAPSGRASQSEGAISTSPRKPYPAADNPGKKGIASPKTPTGTNNHRNAQKGKSGSRIWDPWAERYIPIKIHFQQKPYGGSDYIPLSQSHQHLPEQNSYISAVKHKYKFRTTHRIGQSVSSRLDLKTAGASDFTKSAPSLLTSRTYNLNPISKVMSSWGNQRETKMNKAPKLPNISSTSLGTLVDISADSNRILSSKCPPYQDFMPSVMEIPISFASPSNAPKVPSLNFLHMSAPTLYYGPPIPGYSISHNNAILPAIDASPPPNKPLKALVPIRPKRLRLYQQQLVHSR